MRLPRTTGAAGGLLIVLLGIWGGVIPFVGPYFNYAFGTDQTWHYTMNRLWLDILPGAAAVLGGLGLLVSARRASGVLFAWIALVAGAWFAIGPHVSIIWEHGAGGIGAPLGGSIRRAIELLGYFSGVGVLIVGLAGIAMGRFLSRPRVVTEAAAIGGAGAGALAADRGARPAGAARAPRRGFLRRRRDRVQSG